MLDPRRLLTFRAVAREGSFSRAAEALALTQPAVSQQVGALERELGTRLLERGRGGTVPTRAGALLLEHADALAERLDLADTQMAALVGGERRTMRIGAFPSALATIVPDAIAALRAREPDVEVVVREAVMAELAVAVRAGELDVAVLFQDAADARVERDALRRIDIADEPMVGLISAAHRLAGEEQIALRDLAQDTWTAPSRDGIVVKACRAAGFEPRLAFLARDPLAARGMVAAGLAVTITPRLLATVELPGVAHPGLGRRPPRRTIYALVPDTGAHPMALAMVEELEGAAAAR